MGKARRAAIDARRPYYRGVLAGGLAALFDDRVESCPLCGSTALGLLLLSPDRLQRKPGRFELDECLGCRLVFQNPRLNARGLDFYYADLYDGLGADAAALYYGLGRRIKVRRARRAGGITPRAWLDVGGGNGSFCKVASTVWPETRFEVLDISDSVRDAIKNGWATAVHQEPLLALAATAEDRYDVISMHHYLEHTIDPAAEIEAAARLLTPGGLLIVEVPNPDSRPGRFLKSLWAHWTPSQHLQLLPPSAMTGLIERHGFGVDRVEYGPAHQSAEFTVVVSFLLGKLVPEQIAPWNTARGPWRALTSSLLYVAALPVFIVAVVFDGLWARAIRRSRRLTNTYAVIARRDGRSVSPR